MNSRTVGGVQIRCRGGGRVDMGERSGRKGGGNVVVTIDGSKIASKNL